MNRTLLAVFLVAISGCSAPEPGSARRPPNIVLLVADDLGYAELGCQGGDLPTPRIDALAAGGLRFRAGYVTCPFCSPSRAALLTGRYQQRYGHELNPVEKTNDREDVGLPVEESTLADRLRSAGYATGMTGKWHLGAHPRYHPLRRGFDSFYGFLREGHYYLPPPYDGPAEKVVVHFRPREPEYDRLNPILRGETEISEPEYLTDAIAREAERFIDAHAGRPFFLYVPFNAPHSPMQSRPEDAGRFAAIANPHRRVFAGMVAAMDRGIGRILDALDRRGLERDTLVVFLSDNGGPTQELTSRNDPFRGGKGSHLEGGIRVPFLLRWPAKLPSGVVEERPVSALDVLPTALAAAGAPIPKGLDGVDLLPYLEGRRAELPHPALYWRMGASAALREGRWKLLREKAQEPWRLYDLDADVREERDLAPAQPDLARAMEARWASWSSTLAAPRW